MVTTTKRTPRATRKSKTTRATVVREVSEPKTAKTSTRGRRWEVTMRDWRRYQKDPSADMRQKLLSKYVPLVRNVATRMAMGFPRSVELTDLVNTGVIGLIEAFGNYDPRRVPWTGCRARRAPSRARSTRL
jgi:DNA-directed RNA polymerase sigma subunit (sigma70/sigma32)